jgi:hypothetical protein
MCTGQFAHCGVRIETYAADCARVGGDSNAQLTDFDILRPREDVLKVFFCIFFIFVLDCIVYYWPEVA